MEAKALLSAPSLNFNKMTGKHQPDSPFSHWTCSNDEIIARNVASWDQRKPGDVEGSFIVPIDPEGIFSPMVELVDGDVLVGLWGPRFGQDEEPRLSVFVQRETFEKLPAGSCNSIVYMAEALGKWASTDAEAEITSINADAAAPEENDEPIMPSAFIANQLDLSGGSPTKLTIEEFKPKFDKVAHYWARHAQLAFPGPEYIQLGTYKSGDLHLDESQVAPLRLALAKAGLKLETAGVNYIMENCG